MSNVENEYAWKVCVRCFTFNHAPYIEDAMNGFCMQETDLPFVCTIVDDASTDGEQEVIKRYLEGHFDLEDKSVVRNEETEDYVLTFARHKTNTNCYFAVLYLKYNHYSIKKDKMPYIAEWHENCKYIALCEGDDYWIHPKKMQMQVEFLETNSEYSMCFHGCSIEKHVSIDTNISPSKIENRDYTGNELFETWIVPTASILFRRDVYLNYKKDNRIVSGDIVIILTCAKMGKIRGFKSSMCVYRIHQNGVTYNKEHLRKRISLYVKHVDYIKETFVDILNYSLIQKEYADSYIRMININNSLKLKIKYLLIAIKYAPLYTFNKIIHRFYKKCLSM